MNLTEYNKRVLYPRNRNTSEYPDSRHGLTGIFGKCECGNVWYIRGAGI